MSVDVFQGSEEYIEFLQSSNIISCDIDSKTCEPYGEDRSFPLNHPEKVKFDLTKDEDTVFFDKVCVKNNSITSKSACSPEQKYTVIYYSKKNMTPLSSAFGVSIDAIITHELFHHFSKIVLNPKNYNFVGNYASGKNSLLVRHSMLPVEPAYYSRQQAQFICKFLRSGDALDLETSKYYYHQHMLHMGKLSNITREVQISEATASYLMFSYDDVSNLDLTTDQFCSNLDEFLHNEHYTVLGHSYAVGFLAGAAMDKLAEKIDFKGHSDNSIVDKLYSTVNIEPAKNGLNPSFIFKLKHFFIAQYRRFIMPPSEVYLKNIVMREWMNCLNNGGWKLKENDTIKYQCQDPF